MRIDTKKAGTLTLVLVLSAVIFRTILSAGVYEYFVDDAYIFMRYCENFASGQGLVFNHGEKVLGFTSFSYTILVSLLKYVFNAISTELLIRFLNGALFIVSAILLSRLLYHSESLYYASFCVLLFYFPFVDASQSGMESSLFLVLLLGTLLAIKRGALSYACFFAVVSAMTRPEGVFLVIPTVFLAYRELKTQKFYKIAGMLLVLITICLFLLWNYYGTFIPQPIFAKSSLSSAARWAGIKTDPFEKAILLALGASDIFYLGLPGYAKYVLLTTIFLSFFLWSMNVLHFIRERREILVAAIFYTSILVFYIIGNPVRIFSWYTVPTCLCFVLATLSSIEYLLTKYHFEWIAKYLMLFVIVACLFSIPIALPKRLHTIESHVGDLHHLAVELRDNYKSAKSLTIGDIGIVGYVTNMRIIDLAGLISPETVLQASYEENSLATLVEHLKPDIICLRDNPLQNKTIVESLIRYDSFNTDAQRQNFLSNYSYKDLGSHIYPHIFLRKNLLMHN